MSNNVITFNFNTKAIRVVEIYGKPWFVAADVCRVLGIINQGNAYARLSSDERTNIRQTDIGMPGGRDAVMVSESGLYKLVMRSDKPEAKKIQDWVAREVLPSIRRTGAYTGSYGEALSGIFPDKEFIKTLP